MLYTSEQVVFLIKYLFPELLGTGRFLKIGFTNPELWAYYTGTFEIGTELYHHSADTMDHKSVTAFNLGGMINASAKIHFIFSLGHSIVNDNFFSSYVGVQFTI